MFIMSEMGPRPAGNITSKILVPRERRISIYQRNQGISVIGVIMKDMRVNFVQQGQLPVISVREKATTKQFVRASQAFPSQLTNLRAGGKIRFRFSGRSMGKVMIPGLHK
jgi:hypothetical protein